MAIAYVQGTFHENGSPSVLTCAVTLAAPVGNGNLVCVSVGGTYRSDGGGGETRTVTDDKGNSYTQVDIVGGGNYAWTTWYLANITNAPQTITFTLNATHDFLAIFADEYSGIATASPLDGHNSHVNNELTPGANAAVSGSITPTTDGDLIYGSAVNVDSNTIFAGTSPIAWTGRQVNVDTSFTTEDTVQTTAAAIQATFTYPSGAHWLLCGIMAFKAATVTPTLAMPVFQRRRKLWLPGRF